jgi:hypothetical protein
MGITSWFKFGKNKQQNVNVEKIKTQSIGHGSMAAGNSTATADSLSKMIDQEQSIAKVLMVQDGEYSQQVTEYALKMAQKLDCQIIALDVTDNPLQFTGERKDREIERFYERAQNEVKEFIIKAKSKGITVVHKMEIDNPEKTIARLSKEDAGIRYVLTKPEQSEVRSESDRVQIPVFDLNCSRL